MAICLFLIQLLIELKYMWYPRHVNRKHKNKTDYVIKKLIKNIFRLRIIIWLIIAIGFKITLNFRDEKNKQSHLFSLDNAIGPYFIHLTEWLRKKKKNCVYSIRSFLPWLNLCQINIWKKKIWQKHYIRKTINISMVWYMFGFCFRAMWCGDAILPLHWF